MKGFSFSLSFSLALALLVACSGDKQSFTLSGKFKGLEQGEFVCFSSAPEWGTFDTVRVQGGKFTLTHPLADTVVLTLQYPNFMQTQIIAIPGEEVTVRGDANNMLAIEVGSDDDNELLNEFRKSLLSSGNSNLKSQTSNFKSQISNFITEHAESWAAVAVFQKYFLEAEHPDYAMIGKLLDEMEKKCPGRKVLASMRSQLGALLACGVGKKLPPFKATTLKGDTITNATFKGSPLLITFWSTMVPEYCYPITATHRVLRKLKLSTFNFQLSTLNICLDADTTECRRFLRRDTISGYNVCDLRTFDSPLVRSFGLRGLPSNILVDARGVIQERDIPIADLESRLASSLQNPENVQKRPKL